MPRGRFAVVLIGCIAACSSDATSPDDENDVAYTQVVAGYYHSCAGTAAGDVYCWGDSSSGQAGEPAEACDDPELDGVNCLLGPLRLDAEVPLRALTAGGVHTCALDDGGNAWCWGGNDLGQLGVPGYLLTQCGRQRVTCAMVPERVSALSFVAISAGGSHTCALRPDGAAHCWGYGAYGRLGDGADASTSTVVDVAGNVRFTAIDAGGSSTCGISADGRAYCWGYNHLGQLGDGTTTPRSVPTPVQTTLRFDTIAVGSASACALTSSGEAYCWGGSDDGELGTGAPSHRCGSYGCELVPRAVVGGHTFTAITAGSATFCGTTRDGVLCWGDNGDMQTGTGREARVVTEPTRTSGERLLRVDAGFDHACGIDTRGAAWCWGADWHGSLGGNEDGYRAARPVRVRAPA